MESGLSVTSSPARILAIAALCLAVACGASAASGGSATTATPRSDRMRMDTTEIRNHGYQTVYQAIMATHPDWFRAVGGGGVIPSAGRRIAVPSVGIFIDGSSKPYDVDYLKGLVPDDVRQLRRLSNSESLATYGTEWSAGAIVVTLAR